MAIVMPADVVMVTAMITVKDYVEGEVNLFLEMEANHLGEIEINPLSEVIVNHTAKDAPLTAV